MGEINYTWKEVRKLSYFTHLPTVIGQEADGTGLCHIQVGRGVRCANLGPQDSAEQTQMQSVLREQRKECLAASLPLKTAKGCEAWVGLCWPGSGYSKPGNVGGGPEEEA